MSCKALTRGEKIEMTGGNYVDRSGYSHIIILCLKASLFSNYTTFTWSLEFRITTL